MPHPLDSAIMRTILYADVFDFAMTPREVHHFLIHDQPVLLSDVLDALNTSAQLRRTLVQDCGYVAWAERRALIELRLQREHLSVQMWRTAWVWGARLGRVPFVRMVALTGALAMRNPHSPQDDFDYLLVTVEGRVWLARAFSIVLVRLARLQGVALCPNYVVAQSALTQSRCDLYIAHEVTQALPVYGAALYDAFRLANPWTQAHLPNAGGVLHPIPPIPADASGGGRLKHGLEWLLSGRLGARLEAWEHRRKARRFKRETPPQSAAQIDRSQVKGHFNDHGQSILQAYHERLSRYGLV